MSAFVDRPNSALLVIDVQTDVVAAAAGRDAVVSCINKAIAQARECGVPVIWVQHDDEDLERGSDGWHIVSELVPASDEAIVYKNYRDAFEKTTLEDELARRGVGRLIVTGAQTDYCVRWTLHGALTRGYDTVLVADGHTTDAAAAEGMPDGAALIAHTNAIWGSQAGDRCTSQVTSAAQLQF